MLSFLSRPGRGYLLNVDKNPFVHAILKKTFYNQFCAGETAWETRECVGRLKKLGFSGVILTYARETVFVHRSDRAGLKGPSGATNAVKSDVVSCKHIDEWRKCTLETMKLIEHGDYLALKLSGAGPSVTEAFATGQPAPQQFTDALEEICAKSKARSIRVIVDAESQHFQKGIATATLDAMRQFNRDGTAVVYNTYQAYLKRTPDVLAQHLEAADKDGFTLGLKLVRGAYILSDDRSLMHDCKQDTDDAYNDIARGAIRQQIGGFGAEGGKPFPSVNLFLASHNRESVLGAHRLHQERTRQGLPTVPVGYGQLHGMSDEVSFSLLAERTGPSSGPEVFKCSTWGSMGECVAYLLRRAVENRDAVTRTSDEYTALKSEAWRRLNLLKFGF